MDEQVKYGILVEHDRWLQNINDSEDLETVLEIALGDDPPALERWRVYIQGTKRQKSNPQPKPPSIETSLSEETHKRALLSLALENLLRNPADNNNQQAILKLLRKDATSLQRWKEYIENLSVWFLSQELPLEMPLLPGKDDHTALSRGGNPSSTEQPLRDPLPNPTSALSSARLAEDVDMAGLFSNSDQLPAPDFAYNWSPVPDPEESPCPSHENLSINLGSPLSAGYMFPMPPDTTPFGSPQSTFSSAGDSGDELLQGSPSGTASSAIDTLSDAFTASAQQSSHALQVPWGTIGPSLLFSGSDPNWNRGISVTQATVTQSTNWSDTTEEELQRLGLSRQGLPLDYDAKVNLEQFEKMTPFQRFAIKEVNGTVTVYKSGTWAKASFGSNDIRVCQILEIRGKSGRLRWAKVQCCTSCTESNQKGTNPHVLPSVSFLGR